MEAHTSVHYHAPWQMDACKNCYSTGQMII